MKCGWPHTLEYLFSIRSENIDLLDEEKFPLGSSVRNDFTIGRYHRRHSQELYQLRHTQDRYPITIAFESFRLTLPSESLHERRFGNFMLVEEGEEGKTQLILRKVDYNQK